MGMNQRLLRPSASGFNPRSITGLALWLDASSPETLYTTDAGAVTAVSSPTEIAGCALWLDGADSSAASMTLNGSLVETWKDKSNSGRNATASGTARPTLTPNAQNGRSVLTFDGSATQMQIDSTFLVTSNATIFAVARYNSGTYGAIISSKGSGDTSPSLQHFNGYWQLNHCANQSLIGSQANYAVLSGTILAGATAAYANGLLQDSDAASGTLSSDATKTYIGTYRAAAAFVLNGTVGEIIVYPTALSTTDRARVEAYLAAKWGISGVHAPATETSDPVGAWLDKSGNARHATQSTGANRPKASTAGMNGGRSVQFFGGTSEVLSLGDLSSVFSSAGEIIVAYEPLSDSSYGLYETRANSSYFRNANGLSYFGTLAFGRQSGIAVSMPTSGRHVASMRCSSGGQQVVRLDGAQVFTGSPVNGYTAGTSHVLGNNNNPAADSGLTGYITDVLAFPRILTDAERTRIEKWLAARRGITLAPQVANADAQDWINRVYANGGTVSSGTAAAVSTFCDAIDAASIRGRFYRLNLFAGGTSGTAVGLNSALVPLYRGPSLGGTQYGGATDTNNGPFVPADYNETGASGGLQGNGNKWLTTGLQPHAAASAITANGHLSIWAMTHPASRISVIGCRKDFTSAAFAMMQLDSVGTVWAGWGTGTAINGETVTGAAPRFLAVTRRADGRTYLCNNGEDAFSATNAAAAVTSAEFGVFRELTEAGQAGTTSSRIAGYSVGAELSASQSAALYAAWRTFQNSLQRNV